MNKIDRFVGPYAFLSNFYPSTIVMGGIAYPTVEHAYQAQKTMDHHLREAISLARTPGQAKRLGRALKLREEWELVKHATMYYLVYEKFKDERLRKMLLDTGDAELVEGNDWNDRYWGVHDGIGENHLGKILMDVRKRLFMIACGCPEGHEFEDDNYSRIEPVDDCHFEDNGELCGGEA